MINIHMWFVFIAELFVLKSELHWSLNQLHVMQWDRVSTKTTTDSTISDHDQFLWDTDEFNQTDYYKYISTDSDR